MFQSVPQPGRDKRACPYKCQAFDMNFGVAHRSGRYTWAAGKAGSHPRSTARLAGAKLSGYDVRTATTMAHFAQCPFWLTARTISQMQNAAEATPRIMTTMVIAIFYPHQTDAGKAECCS